MLIFICFRLGTIHNLYGDLKNPEEARVNKESPASRLGTLGRKSEGAWGNDEPELRLHRDTEWTTSREGPASLLAREQ